MDKAHGHEVTACEVLLFQDHTHNLEAVAQLKPSKVLRKAFIQSWTESSRCLFQ